MSQAQRLMSMVAAPLSSSNLKQALLVFYVMRSALTDPCFNLNFDWRYQGPVTVYATQNG